MPRVSLNGVFTATKGRSVQTRYNLLTQVKREVSERLQSSFHKSVVRNLLNDREAEQEQRLWDVEVKIGRRSTYQLHPLTSVTQVFDDTDGKLLILGAPGAGKTTTLLQLAIELIDRAQKDDKQPIPLLLNFSSWTDDKPTLADWLLAELQSKYGVSVDIGKQWIDRQQLLPLLDGLDELDLNRQARCIQAINRRLEGYKPPKHLVICTRLEQYKSCNAWLRLNGAVYLRPLTDAQIQQYLISARSRELWESIKTDSDLLALAKTPLLLCMMALAYEEILINSWRRLTSKRERYLYLLNAYIRRMLGRKSDRQWYRTGKEPRPEQTRYWLIWLAKRMKDENQTEFFIKSINHSWLQTPTQKWIHRLGVGLIFGVIAAIIGGLLGSLLLGIISALIAGIIGVLIPSIPGIENFSVRLILWWNGYIPWNYARFLNYATEKLFLQRIDGHYRFIHELLRDHFAQMPLN
jgi:predicted NACHT family NTPase